MEKDKILKTNYSKEFLEAEADFIELMYPDDVIKETKKLFDEYLHSENE